MLFYLYFVSAFCYLVAAKNEEYKGYKVYNIKLDNSKQQENLHLLKTNSIDFWRRPNFQYGVVGKVMVPPFRFDWFENKLKELGIQKDLFIEDVHEFLTKEDIRPRSSDTDSDADSDAFDVKRYHKYDDILTYLQTLQAKYPQAKVELVEYGVTNQNRPLVYLKITSNTGTDQEKPIVLIESGINPRDWVTIPAALNIVEQILGEQRFLEDLDWIIVPVMNPDGYEYTRDGHRLWQKSRSTASHMAHICPGVNLNRNFDLDWLHFDSSSSPCSHVYGGTEPFSEIETKMIRDIIDTNGSKIILYISLQNNGGYISYPWNYERAASGMFVHHHLLALNMINVMNGNYVANVGSVLFDRSSGTNIDYAREKEILFTYSIDIEQGDSGVIIAEDDIGDIVDDVWKAVAVAAEQMNLYV